MDQDAALDELVQKLAKGEITPEEYETKADELLASSEEDASQDSVSEERIRSAARKARSLA